MNFLISATKYGLPVYFLFHKLRHTRTWVVSKWTFCYLFPFSVKSAGDIPLLSSEDLSYQHNVSFLLS